MVDISSEIFRNMDEKTGLYGIMLKIVLKFSTKNKIVRFRIYNLFWTNKCMRTYVN